jgi:hypothetical protein
MDWETHAHLRRLLAGRGPREQIALLMELVGSILVRAGLNRNAKRNLFEQLALRFKLTGGKAQDGLP